METVETPLDPPLGLGGNGLGRVIEGNGFKVVNSACIWQQQRVEESIEMLDPLPRIWFVYYNSSTLY